MKKRYVCPEMLVIAVKTCLPLTTSGQMQTSDLDGLDGYGGETSGKEAGARFGNLWDDEE